MYKRARKSYSKPTVTGSGDYSLNQIVKGSGKRPLQFGSSKGLSGDVYVTHREFVSNITVTPPQGGGSTPFQVTSYPINPGLLNSFPFLSQIAQAFTLFEFDGLVYEYKPTSGEYGSSSSNQLGKVIMCTNYDPDVANFTSSVQMENYDYANSCKPSTGAMHGVECKEKNRATNILYCRNSVSAKDKVFTDVGNFQIATEGINFAVGTANSAIVGELWVSYKVRFSRANINSANVGSTVLFDSFASQCVAGGDSAAAETAGTNGTWFGTALATNGDALVGNPTRFGPAPSTYSAQPDINNNLGGVLDCNLSSATLLGYTNPNNLATPLIPTYTGIRAEVMRYRFPVALSSGFYRITYVGQGQKLNPVASTTTAGWLAGGGFLFTNCTPISNSLFYQFFGAGYGTSATTNANGIVGNQQLNLNVCGTNIGTTALVEYSFDVAIVGTNASVLWNAQNTFTAATAWTTANITKVFIQQLNPSYLS